MSQHRSHDRRFRQGVESDLPNLQEVSSGTAFDRPKTRLLLAEMPEEGRTGQAKGGWAGEEGGLVELGATIVDGRRSEAGGGFSPLKTG